MYIPYFNWFCKFTDYYWYRLILSAFDFRISHQIFAKTTPIDSLYFADDTDTKNDVNRKVMKEISWKIHFHNLKLISLVIA